MSKLLRLHLPALLLVGTMIGCGPANEGVEGDKAGTASARPETEEAPKETAGQKDALRKADKLLSASAYSRTGLIEQLELEQVSNEDATYAVDAVGVDWRDQAAKKAKEYMDDGSPSRDELKEQLTSDGFTEDEVEYGVSQFFAE